MKRIRILPLLLVALFVFSLTVFAEESSLDISTDVTESSAADSVVIGKSYTVTYGYKSILYDGKEPADYVKGNTPAPCIVAEGDNHTVLKNPYTFRDYVFAGWSDGEKVYSEGEVIYNIKSNISLTATWKRGDEAELVTYGRLSYSNGKELDVQVGTTVVLDNGTWVDVDGRYFDGGSQFLMSRHFASFTASSKPAGLVSVSYDGAGASGGMQCVFEIANGTSFTVDGCFAERDGYEFVGWTNTAGKIFRSGDSFVVDGNTILTALWQESSKPLPDYCTVNIKVGNGGVANPQGKQTVEKGGSIEVSFTPASGYKLVSVLRDGEELGAGGTYTLVVNADTKLEAVFAEAPLESKPEEISGEKESSVEHSSATESKETSAAESMVPAMSEDKAPTDDNDSNKEKSPLAMALGILGITVGCGVVAVVVSNKSGGKKKRKR